MTTLSEWRYGIVVEKKLLETCRDTVPAMEPGAEIISYDSALREDERPDPVGQVQNQLYKTTY